MAKFNVVDMNGQHVSEIELSDAVFGITPNEKAVHIAVVNFLANQRQGTQNTKILSLIHISFLAETSPKPSWTA